MNFYTLTGVATQAVVVALVGFLLGRYARRRAETRPTAPGAGPRAFLVSWLAAFLVLVSLRFLGAGLGLEDSVQSAAEFAVPLAAAAYVTRQMLKRKNPLL